MAWSEDSGSRCSHIRAPADVPKRRPKKPAMKSLFVVMGPLRPNVPLLGPLGVAVEVLLLQLLKPQVMAAVVEEMKVAAVTREAEVAPTLLALPQFVVCPIMIRICHMWHQ